MELRRNHRRNHCSVLLCICLPLVVSILPQVQTEVVLDGGRLQGAQLRLTATDSPYLVTSADVTVAVADTLYVESGVEMRFSPGLSLLVQGDIVVSGTEEKPVVFTLHRAASPTTSTQASTEVQQRLRLVNGTSDNNGIVQFYRTSDNSEGYWTNICDSRASSLQKFNTDPWAKNISEMVCRYLGYADSYLSTVIPVKASHLGMVTAANIGTTWNVHVNCQGNLSSVEDCFMVNYHGCI